MCVAKEIKRILIQKRKRVVITHLKKIRRRRIKVERKIKTRRSHTLFSPFENLFQFQVEYILREFFRESLSRDSKRRMNLFSH